MLANRLSGYAHDLRGRIELAGSGESALVTRDCLVRGPAPAGGRNLDRADTNLDARFVLFARSADELAQELRKG